MAKHYDYNIENQLYDCYVVNSDGKLEWVDTCYPIKAMQAMKERIDKPFVRHGWGFWTKSGVFVGRIEPHYA